MNAIEREKTFSRFVQQQLREKKQKVLGFVVLVAAIRNFAVCTENFSVNFLEFSLHFSCKHLLKDKRRRFAVKEFSNLTSTTGLKLCLHP